MTADSPKAFFMSATLHIAVVAVLLLLMVLNRAPEPMKVFEVVAGEGDNFAAKEAPALGTPGVKVTVPTPPTPTPDVVKIETTPPVATPIVPVPAPKPEQKVTPPPKPVEKAPDLAKQFKQDIRIAKNNRKRQLEKEQAAEAKRIAEEQKKLTKEQFDLQNKAKTTPQPTKTAPPKIAKIDAEGIAKGVVAGSPTSKVGAGGKALVNNNEDELIAYFAMFKTRVLKAFEPAGLGEDLVATIVVHISAGGVLSRPRIQKSSGSDEFDRAVIAAISRVTMPPRPDKKGEDLVMSFRTKDVEAR